MAEILLEVCVDSPRGLAAAVEGGADRIELCAALAVGGLTPTAGLAALAASLTVPTRAMIRSRVGGFIYDQRDLDAMRVDIDAMRAAGLDGVVIGANRRDGHLDEAALRLLAEQASGLTLTLHRAVDLTPDPLAAVDLAIALGFATILTSGGQPTALAGSAKIAAMVARAAGRIEILAGSGVKPDNVAELVRSTGVTAVHGSCSGPYRDSESRAVEFGFIGAGARDTDADQVRRIKAILTGLI